MIGRRTTRSGALLPVTTVHKAYVPPSTAPQHVQPRHDFLMDTRAGSLSRTANRSPTITRAHMAMRHRNNRRRATTAPSGTVRSMAGGTGERSMLSDVVVCIGVVQSSHRHMARVMGIRYDRPKPLQSAAPGTPGALAPARPTIVHPILADAPPTAITPLRSPSIRYAASTSQAPPSTVSWLVTHCVYDCLAEACGRGFVVHLRPSKRTIRRWSYRCQPRPFPKSYSQAAAPSQFHQFHLTLRPRCDLSMCCFPPSQHGSAKQK